MTAAPIVTTKQGDVLGRIAQDIRGLDYHSFQGIPYAKPPIGNLRFKSPQPAEPWTGTLEALKEGDECYSKHMITKQMVGSEDCLSLNVYTPPKVGGVLKPVMVWIHGGAFTSGSNKTDLYGPEYLMAEDVVLVIINYRLGILGFLSLDDPEVGVPGNAGLKDQVLALKWVQQNIGAFGGDAGNVTIFGESAGAASVHYLVLSPLAKGLFHKAIAQSGSVLNPFAHGRRQAEEIAEILDLKSVSDKEIYQHLADLPIEKLFEVSEKVRNATGVHEKMPFAPVIEKYSKDAIISEDPLKLLKFGKYNHVPILFGFTTREGMLMEMVLAPEPPGKPDDFEKAVSFTLGVEPRSSASKPIAEKIKKFYYGEKGSEDNVDNFYLLHTDIYFVHGIRHCVKAHVKTSPAPVYLYRMSVESDLNVLKNLIRIKVPGVCHGDDLGYLFKNAMSPELKPGSLEEISVKRFTKLWANFAKFGNPTPESSGKDSLIPVKWERVTKDVIHYLDIGEELTVGVDPEVKRMEFWDDIFSKNPLYLF